MAVEVITDYVSGDEPVPVGAVVKYSGVWDLEVRDYLVTEHADPQNHPNPPAASYMTLEEAYADGVAYHLWPVGVPQKFGNRDQGVSWVRRTSFRRSASTTQEKK